MARRSKDWNEGLARDLMNPDFAREFLMAAIDEGVPLQQALGKVIRAIGVKEFALKIKMAPANLQRVIDPRRNPTQATLNRLLKPLGLRLSLAVIKTGKRKREA
jgi:DNA-binding phage protein